MGVCAIATIGQLVTEAKRRKSDARGQEYTYRELARDAGDMHFTTAQKIANDQRHPTREMVLALSRALTPYLNQDEALIAAGYVPEGERSTWIKRLGASLRDGIARDDETISGILRLEKREASEEDEGR